MSTTRNSVVIYRSFYEALASVSERSYKKIMNAVMAYALDGIEPKLSGMEYAIFALAKPQIDANNRKFENGKQGGRPQNQSEKNDNQTITKEKPNDNQNETKEKTNDNHTKPNSRANEKCEMRNENIVSKKERKERDLKKENYTRESYDDLMDAWELSFAVREAVGRFIKHCTLNGQILTNDRLDGIIAELELHRENDDEKIQAINDAINGGYFDIRRG